MCSRVPQTFPTSPRSVYETQAMTWAHALSNQQSELTSAALRHIADAEDLLRASPVQALYLAGYGPECARKAALARWTDRDEDLRNRAIGHRFDGPAEVALQWFCDLDPLAPRYALLRWKVTYNVLGEWKEDVRYGRSDSITVTKARRFLHAAQELTLGTIAKLWADGRVPPLDALTRVAP